MKKEFDIEEVWIPHEIHPETPPEGQSITDRFSQVDVDQIVATCRQRGQAYGLHFTNLTLLSNTRLALEAAEFAREHDKYHILHGELFKAYFADGKNIGDIQVLLEVGRKCGLDLEKFETALDDGRYSAQVSQGSVLAKESGVTAIPAFFVEDLSGIIGAMSEDVFRQTLARISEDK